MVNVLGSMFQDAPNPGIPPALAALSGIFMIVSLVVAVILIASLWKLFEKAGEPGWAAIVPIYNLIVILKIAGKPIWWIILLCIPLVNIIVGILVLIAFAARFGKGVGYALGMLILPFIFYPLLAFGDSRLSAAAA